MKRIWLLGLGLLAGFACVTGPSTLSVASFAVAPPSPLVARKVPRRALLVLDPAKVPDVMTVLVDGKNQGGKLTDVRAFVTRDLKRAFAPYFDDVRVVAPAEVAGAERPSVVIDVRLDRIEVLVSATGTRQLSDVTQSPVTLEGEVEVSSGSALLTWALALRPSESNDYLFSFADSSPSLQSDDPSTGFRSMFEQAIVRLMRRYDREQVEQKLLALTPGIAAPAP